MTSADFATLKLDRIGPVLRITIDHPSSELNTVDGLMHDELCELFRQLKIEDQARAVVLTGTGRAFTAGGDFEWFTTVRDIEHQDKLRRAAKQMIWDLLDVEIPIVAALNGHAVGLGASLALLCDIVLMSEGATISDPHVRVGLVAGDGGTAIWPLVVGPLRAKEYLLTGDPVTAADAERMGLVNRVIPYEQLGAAALDLAERLAAGAPLAIRYTKLAINKLVKEALNVAFDTATSHEVFTFLSQDHAEAVRAIHEKRTPRFSGR